MWILPAVVHSCTLRHAIVYRSIYIERRLVRAAAGRSLHRAHQPDHQERTG
ncbi:hypothetical protein ACU4GD_01300 [Cupriavidus basilensis]